jgi:hypothetical protein
MATLVSILALTASASCADPSYARPVEQGWPVEAITMFARAIDAYLGERSASDGMVFSSRVAELFRERIDVALRRRDVEWWLENERDRAEDDRVEFPPVYANQRYPDRATHGFPTRLLWCLPPVPEPLEYRIVGRQLVILDVDLNRVVDVLPHAFSVPRQTRR